MIERPPMEHYRLGIPQLDEPHQQLYDAFQDIFQLVSEGGEKARLCELVNNLEQALITHFQEEEALMRQTHYHNLGAHQSQHEEYLKYLQRLKQSLVCQGMASELDRFTLQYLFDWFLNHMREADRQLGRFLLDQQRSAQRKAMRSTSNDSTTQHRTALPDVVQDLSLMPFPAPA